MRSKFEAKKRLQKKTEKTVYAPPRNRVAWSCGGRWGGKEGKPPGPVTPRLDQAKNLEHAKHPGGVRRI